jgi:hypothetical protein
MSSREAQDRQAKAREAMMKRGKKEDPQKQQFQIVIYGFLGVCVASVLYVVLNPTPSFSKRPVIDESAILVHNGNSDVMFKQGPNKIFETWTMEDVNDIMNNYLADNPNVPQCRTSSEESETAIPESFDWREQFPDCVQEVANQGNCSAAYAMVATSVTEDRICQV